MKVFTRIIPQGGLLMAFSIYGEASGAFEAAKYQGLEVSEVFTGLGYCTIVMSMHMRPPDIRASHILDCQA